MDKILAYIILLLPILAYSQSNYCLNQDTTLCYKEYSYPSGFPIEIEKKWESDDRVTSGSLLMADMDNDCKTDIIVASLDTIFNLLTCANGIRILDFETGRLKFNIETPAFYCQGGISFCVGDVDSDGILEIILATAKQSASPNVDRRLICYNLDGSIRWISSEKYDERFFGHSRLNSPQLADFNNDGIPEVYMKNFIFNAQTGVKLLDGGLNGLGTGFSFNTVHGLNIAVNLDDDPELELASGYSVYDFNIINLDGESGNTFTVHNILESGCLRDGFTTVGDLNMDGQLDVIIHSTSRCSPKPYKMTLYAYTFVNDSYDLLGQVSLSWPTNDSYDATPPLIADFNNDGDLSVVVRMLDEIKSYKFENNQFVEEWTLDSHRNGFNYGYSAYDFNNDGNQEFIIQRRDSIRIYSLENNVPFLQAVYSCETYGDFQNVISGNYNQETKLCSVCKTDVIWMNNTGYPVYKVLAFGSPDTLPGWTPARGIWNQYNYNVLNINDDGTVPQYMENNATYEDGRYNNFYQQATVLDSNGMYRQPAAGLYGEIECVQYEPTTQTYTVTFDLFNRSDASRGADAGLPISFYDGDPETDGTLLGTYLTTLSINPNDMLNDLTYTFIAGTLDQLFMVINTEKSTNGVLQDEDFNHPECDYTDNIFQYTNLPTTDQQTAEICEGNSYDFYGDMLDTKGNYYHRILDESGCDSIVVELELGVVDTVRIQSMDVACDTLIWNGDVLTESGNYQFRTQNAQGCDSIVNLDLTIYKSEEIKTTQIACDSFAWNGEVYSESGAYTYATQSFYGCDSTTLLDLTIHPSYDIDLIQQACDSFEWNGDVYRSDGLYTYQSVSQFGCDSIVTLELTINDVLESEETAVSCDSFIWNGTTYPASGQYSFITQSAQGCDSIAQLTLDIYYATSSTLQETACDSFLWNGNIYDQSGTYQFEGVTTRGCDSLVVLDLDILQSTTSYDQVSACDSFIWNGTVYDQSGTYDYTIQNAVGCDSVATINLILSKSTTEMTLEKACDSITWNGQTYTQDGLYNYSSTNALGCDSTVLLELTINRSKSINLNESVCDSLIYQGEVLKNTGDYVYELQTNEGCDSIINLSVSILSNSNEEKIEACDEYKWPKNGENYTNSGQYEVRYTNSLGCDSIEILTLDIYESYEFLTVEEACNTYTWTVNDEEISETGIYTYDLQSSKGCDSTYVLDLIINSEFEDTDTVMTPNEFTWLVNGITYTTSGTYSASYINQNNCDSTHILLLTIDNTIEVYAPNIIRPGSNTYFTIFGNDGITTIDELSIYDRWGNQVFNAQNIPPNQPELGWNGTVNGRLVNPGVYVWHAVISTTEGKVIERTGDITVIR